MEDDNLLSYRLRSLRSRKRIIKKDVEKQIRKKCKRSKEVSKILRNLPLVPLENPYQLGFVRFFVVRDDVMRSSDGAFFEELLKKINTYMYSGSRQFLKKKRKFGRRIYVEREQKLYRVSSYSWSSPKFGLTPRERQYFVRKEEYCPFRKCNETYYEFTEQWRFTLRTRPHMITHYKPIDAELKKEEAELDAYLEQYKVAGIINKKMYGKSCSWDSKKEDPDLIKSRKYITCTMSATEIAESFLDDESII